jgi:hypothetical protein
MENNNFRKSVLTFVTTNECSARCKHCLMLSGPKRHEKLEFPFIKKIIDKEAIPLGKKLIIFTGGESTRLKDDLYDAIAYSTSCGLATRLVTNAEWAVNDRETRTMITTFKECGLNELNISCDDFHAEWIPVENVIRAWRVAEQTGCFTSLVLAICSGPISTITPESMMKAIGENIPLAYDEQGYEIPLSAVGPGETRKMISNARILRLGRGRNLDKGYCEIPNQFGIERTPCPLDNRQPVFMPSGHRCVCCGINPEWNKVLDFDVPIPTDFREVRNLILQAISRFGPGYLMNIVKEVRPDVQFRTEYSSICEICSDITHSKVCLQVLSDNRGRMKEDLEAWKLIHALSSVRKAS